jgi:tRNA threonylcarbamoyladenosine biosynthesis protein TsaB
MTKMQAPLILAVETATRSGSISLARGRDILCSRSGDPALSHSSHLIEHIDSLLLKADARLGEMQSFAAAVGPGSFTGLRIGLATVKAFAVYLERKCVGVSTLAAIAHGAGSTGQTVAALPAGRGEVFAQLFEVISGGTVEPMDDAAHLSPTALRERYGHIAPLRWAGEGARLHRDDLRAWAANNGVDFVEAMAPDRDSEERGRAHWELVDSRGELAESVAALALVDYQQGKAITPGELRAVYVRPSDAEIRQG